MLVELRSVPDCPNLAPVREALHTSLSALGLAPDVIEVVGDYPSPSVLVNGVDVMGSAAADGSAACRLDLPTPERIRAALHRAIAREPAAPPPVRTQPPRCGHSPTRTSSPWSVEGAAALDE